MDENPYRVLLLLREPVQIAGSEPAVHASLLFVQHVNHAGVVVHSDFHVSSAGLVNQLLHREGFAVVTAYSHGNVIPGFVRVAVGEKDCVFSVIMIMCDQK